jgi:hypothetical protein
LPLERRYDSRIDRQFWWLYCELTLLRFDLELDILLKATRYQWE